MKEVADKFYGTKVDMKMEKQEVVFDTVVTSFHMKFENKVFIAAKEAEAKVKESSMPVRAAILFEMFPFCILFSVSWICLDSKPPISKSYDTVYRTIPHFTIQHLEFFNVWISLIEINRIYIFLSLVVVNIFVEENGHL